MVMKIDAPTGDTRTCRTHCYYAHCGDGIVDPLFGEQCDGTANCTVNCTLLYCGDNIVTPGIGETCDPPNSFNCSANCTRIPRCGDFILDAGEQCDTGGVATGYCRANCTNLCGDGIVQGNYSEQCDNGLSTVDGNSNTRPNACRNNCVKAWCGDGVVDPVNCEQCDSGRLNSNTAPNACRLNCKVAHCGDGVIDSGEQCDDNNNVDGDGCTCCRLDCGNGIVDLGEECDDGSLNSNVFPDRCRTNCTIHRCGDGVTDFNEECDYKSGNSPNCTTICTLPFCGDGVVQYNLGEECDAGDANSYTAIDGCSPICTLNRCGQSQSSATVDLSTIFGPAGINSVSGAYHYWGSHTHPPCTENVEWFVLPTLREMSLDQYLLFTTTVAPNARPAQGRYGRHLNVAPTTTYGYVPNDYRARNVCGDGIVELHEECDRGRHNNDQTPNACRTNCMAPSCGDGVVDSGEQCDGGDYCSPVCTFVHWTYMNNTQYRDQCGGYRQSPIRLPDTCPTGRALNLNNPANIQYNPTPVTLFNTGKDILFPVQNGGTFNWKGHTYTLTELRFVEPSEHYIGNKRYAFEVQLWHTPTTPGDDQFALAVLFDESESRNAFLQPILDRLPEFSHCSCGNGKKEDVQWWRSGKITREECDCGKLNNDHTPNTCRTNCKLPKCGDWVQDSCEACDQGTRNSDTAPNSCRANCVLPFCGDGVTDDLFHEQCDDGNNINGDGCNSNCKLECGNGVVEGNEQCDDGIYNSDTKANECRRNCQLYRCGDGVIDLGEQCDNGRLNNNTAQNACRLGCTLPVCGDGVTDSLYGEECDGGAGCSRNCTLLCGNGVLDAGEQCDSGSCNSNTVPNACRLNCRLPSCGDGVRDSNEQCDTGANTPQCQSCIVRCGNGIVEPGEECDNGIYNTDSVPNACRTNCKYSYCGDGILDHLEECDNGASNANSSDACRTWCRIPKCGDGIVDTGRKENCDDGNTLDGDGCDSCCQRECGNGRVDQGEQCDDGSRNSDTLPACCRTNCRFPVCGDGVTDFGEECDNGRNTNKYAPNTCRPDCTLPQCGDGIVDHLYGEVCDQGTRNSWTQVDGCSPHCTPNVCRQSIYYNTTVNPSALIPTQAGTFWYQGSDAHSCEENTQWFVFTTPQSISRCQLEQFRKVLHDNANCLQSRNHRHVEYLQLTARCGDGLIEGNEECDAGPHNSDYAPNACRRNCRLPRCGDGVQDKGEQCDGTPNCTPTCSLACSWAASYPENENNTRTHTETVVDENVVNVNFADILSP